ncbi:zinc finger protein RFP-like isoform X1 [Eublepharis macularius]|uniref:Zinc finger protein RFP-like isoform X1 n=1 Tax=Eublepharis macularius TaxID=481883 RepID=A0AA97KWJ3_EUBMA|nr:zinc finger protein RFP-like isoform X1 [Eublepharis macularius]
MAAAGAAQELCEELTCSVCLDYFTDPVTIAECGHNFCQACLTLSWGESGAEAFCPQCRGIVQQRNPKPNRQLANVVEIVKKLRLQERRVEAKAVEGKGRTCEKHEEPLKLFCKDDQGLICVVCDRSKEHRNHDVTPVEEARQEYKDKFCDLLEVLRQERTDILAHKVNLEEESLALLEQTKSERQKAMAELRKLNEFLEEQEKLLLAQMEEVDKEIARERDEHLARLSKELSSLENLIQEMEEKIQLPASELLQDVKSTLQRYEEKEEFESPVTFSSELTRRIQSFTNINCSLENDLEQLKDALAHHLQLQKEPTKVPLQAVHYPVRLKTKKRGFTPRYSDKQRTVFNTFQALMGDNY